MSDNNTQMANGFFPKQLPETAPDFVKGKVSIKREEFIEFLKEQEWDWVNIDILESKGWKWYWKVNDWKPNTEETKTETKKPEVDTSSLPF